MRAHRRAAHAAGRDARRRRGRHRRAVERAFRAGARPTTLVTATDGNHGRAVARVAAWRGLRAQVFVPRGVPAASVEAIRGEGAEVVLLDASYDEAVSAAAAAASPGALLVQDTAWPGYEEIPGWIVEGYQTLCAEIDAQTERVDLVAVPVGVGSLAQAVVTHYRSGGHAPSVLSVEPDSAACVLASLQAGQPMSVETGTTVMNGLNCGTPSALAWPVLAAGLDAAVAVTDAETLSAVETLAAAGISSGPSGAASYAGALAVSPLPPHSTVILLSTEAGQAPRVDSPAG